MIRTFRLLAAVTAGIALAGQPAPASAGDLPQPQYLPAPCSAVDIPADMAVRLRCGTVVVPRLHDEPEAGSYRLAVRVLKASAHSDSSQAILLIPGGPGRSGLSAARLPELGANFPGRDIVTYDPRGTGASSPRPCAGLNAFDHRFIGPAFSASALHTAIGQSLQACLAEAQAADISPAEFGTPANAEDANLVRQALGYSKLDVIGTSYGATTALELASRHPETIRSITLDSPYIGTLSPLSGPENWTRARMAIFSECERDPSCIAAYPELAAELDRVLASLRENPLAVPVPEAFGAAGNVIQLDAIDFETLLFDMATNRGSAALIPAMVRAAGQGRTSAIAEALIAGREDRRELSAFVFAAVTCQDGTAAHEAARLGPTAADEMAVTFGIVGPACGTWAGHQETPSLPTDAAIPVITLSGLIDPITPPANARTVAYMLGPVVRQFEFPSVGHDVLAQSLCATQITQQFLANPTGPITWNCVRDQPPVAFRPPAL